jgi:hypothetical protein
MRKIVLIVIVGLLGASASASAQTTGSATPKGAGRPSVLHFNIDGAAAPIGGRLPRAMEVQAPAGFQVTPQAVAQRCTQESAKLNECPAGSRLGRGSLVVSVTAPNAGAVTVRTVTIPLLVYVHSGTKILAVAKVFGWQVVPGTLSTHSGFTIGFDPLPAGPPFPGVTYALKGITLNLGATRVVKKRVKTQHGTRASSQRLNYFRNPPSCHGGWKSSVSLTFRDGTAAQLSVPVPCSKS